MNPNEIIYQLVVDDIQNVANQEVNRKLTNLEIERIKSSIADRIDWYSAIFDSIQDCLSNEFHQNN